MSTVTVLEAEAASPSIAVPGAVRTPTVEILREITRGGLAGIIVGLIVGGIGGRLVMRLAALLVPSSIGAHTENGNVIGEITLGGTFALLMFGGLAMGVIAGSLWVVLAPWLPTRPAARAAVAAIIIGAIATPGLVSASNIDFIVLRRDPLVVASLIGLVALFGPALVLVERWLDRRLPHAARRSDPATAYALVTAMGVVLTVFLVVPSLLTSSLGVPAYALLLVGAATLVTWVWRVRGDAPMDPRLTAAVRVTLVVAVVTGLARSIAEVRGALGMF